MKKISILFLLSTIIIFNSCEKEKNPEFNNANSVVIDVSKHFFDWIYFSFTENDTVQVSDYQSDHNWDLGIRYIHFRTNGGASGTANGGVYDLGKVDYDPVDLSNISIAAFTEDDSITVVKVVGMPPQWETVPGSVPMEGVFLAPQGPPPNTYAPNHHVYIIRTADGKHVKFQATTFFNDFAEEGHVHFKYEFLD